MSEFYVKHNYKIASPAAETPRHQQSRSHMGAREPPGYLSAKDIAAQFSVSTSTAYRWMDRIPTLKINGIRRVSREDLSLYIEEKIKWPERDHSSGRRRTAGTGMDASGSQTGARAYGQRVARITLTQNSSSPASSTRRLKVTQPRLKKPAA